MIKVLSFLSNGNCFAGHGFSATVLKRSFSVIRWWLFSEVLLYFAGPLEKYQRPFRSLKHRRNIGRLCYTCKQVFLRKMLGTRFSLILGTR